MGEKSKQNFGAKIKSPVEEGLLGHFHHDTDKEINNSFCACLLKKI